MSHHHHHHGAPGPVITVRHVALFNQHSGRYLIAEHHGLVAHHDLHHHGHKGHFYVETNTSVYPPLHAIKAHHGHYVGINHHGQAFLSQHQSQDTVFLIELHPEHGNKLAYRGAHHPLYLTVHENGVHASPTLSHHQLFNELPV